MPAKLKEARRFSQVKSKPKFSREYGSTSPLNDPHNLNIADKVCMLIFVVTMLLKGELFGIGLRDIYYKCIYE